MSNQRDDISMSSSLSTSQKKREKLESLFFLLILLFVSLFFLYLLKPFGEAIFWACLIGMIFQPFYLRLANAWGGRRNFAALAVLALSLIIVIVPVLFFLSLFFQESAELYQRLQNGELDLNKQIEIIRETFPALQDVAERLNFDIDKLKKMLTTATFNSSRFLAQNAIQFGQGALQFFISLGLMLYLSFFTLRDGQKLALLVKRALPLGETRKQVLFTKFTEVTLATVKGNLVVATVQGGLGGLLFWLVGIPGALLWGGSMIILSLIPVVGAGLIWGPAAIYFFATGAWSKGLILVAFGTSIIGLVDNVLRPVLVGRSTKLPDYIVLFSTLGGLNMFGISGFVVGPLIAVSFVALWDLFTREFSS